MLHQLHKMAHGYNFVVACSGGSDSMAVVDFYRRGGKNFRVAYFDHKTGNRQGALPVIEEYCSEHNLGLMVGEIESAEVPAGRSREDYWRQERYRWLISLDRPIVTAHHLNDAAETYLFGTMHGTPKLIQSQTIASSFGQNSILYRPFLTCTKQELTDWCIRHNVKWFEDKSNEDVACPRNRIRHNILPEVLKVNPGFLKVIRKKYLSGNTQ